MRLHRRLWVFMVLAAVLVWMAPRSVSAQFTPSEIRISFTDAFETSDKPNELLTRVYFTLVDPGGKPVVEPKIRSSSMAMLDPGDGGPYKAEIRKADEPIFITIVLDASGSMQGSEIAMREAAIKFVEGGVSNARYSIIAFNDQLFPLTDFTDDKGRLKDAINRVQPTRLAGTCLFDATIDALRRMAEVVRPQDRRAIVVMTDGVDQKLVAGKTEICSKGTLEDVRLIATNRKFRIPLYTIGFNANGEIDESALRTMALTTGGSVTIGANFESLFKDVNDALNAQMVAEGFTKPQQGERIGALIIELDNGTTLTPTNFEFTSPRDFSFKTPTPTTTFTPLPPVGFEVPPARFDPANKEYLVTVTSIISPERIKTFSFQLITEGGLAARGEIVEPAPLAGEVKVGVPEDLPAQKLSIRIKALDDGGLVLFQRDIPADWRPTLTPTFTPTNTALPIGARLDSIRYENDQTKETIILKLTLSSPERIDRLRVTLVNSDTGIAVRDFSPLAVAPELKLSLNALQDAGLPAVPAAGYRVNVFALSSDGTELSISTIEFTHTRQPTPTPTPTFTATPVIPVAIPVSVEIDRAAEKLIFKVETKNEELIKSYRLEFTNGETNEKVTERNISVPPYDRIEVPFADLPGGTYIITFRGMDADGKPITEFAGIKFAFVQNTPVPSPTDLPTATPTPNGLIDQLRRALENPDQRGLVIGGFAVLAGGLLLVMFLLLRRPRKAATGTGFLAEMTTAMNVQQMQEEQKRMQAQQGQQRPAPKAPPPAAPMVPPPAPPPMQRQAPPMEVERTSPIPQMLAPQAGVRVEMSREQVHMGKTYPLTTLPFSFGRKTRNLNFDSDDNVSRNHAEIIFESGAYYIQDHNSTHGTFVDGKQVPGGTRAPLHNGCEIRLGTTTVMRFQIGGGGGNPDPDATNFEMPGYQR